MKKTLKVNELRVGNWYKSVKFNSPVQCDLSDLYNLCVISDGAYNDPPIDEMFAPILLTEEWFLKSGFELFPWGFVHKTHGDKGVLIRYSTKPEHKFWLEVGNGLRCDLLYVHQLQNVYFDLNDEELLITDP